MNEILCAWFYLFILMVVPLDLYCLAVLWAVRRVRKVRAAEVKLLKW